MNTGLEVRALVTVRVRGYIGLNGERQKEAQRKRSRLVERLMP
jgi:hypothetical protein